MLRSWASIVGRRYVCAVARTSKEQADGLQRVARLGPMGAMLFPFGAPRPATFWMGRVAFPIDLAFLDGAGRVGKIVRAAQPGTDERWYYSAASAVIEVEAGGLGDVDVGSPLDAPLTPADFARFQDRQLIDESSPNAVDGPMPHFKRQLGNDPKTPSDIVDTTTEDMQFRGGAYAGGAYAGSAYDSRIERTALMAGGADELAVAAAVARAIPLSWTPDRLNGGATQQAQLTPEAVYAFLAPAVANAEEGAALGAMVADGRFQELLGDALILADRVDLAKVGPRGLSVWRGTQ